MEEFLSAYWHYFIIPLAAIYLIIGAAAVLRLHFLYGMKSMDRMWRVDDFHTRYPVGEYILSAVAIFVWPLMFLKDSVGYNSLYVHSEYRRRIIAVDCSPKGCEEYETFGVAKRIRERLKDGPVIMIEFGQTRLWARFIIKPEDVPDHLKSAHGPGIKELIVWIGNWDRKFSAHFDVYTTGMQEGIENLYRIHPHLICYFYGFTTFPSTCYMPISSYTKMARPRTKQTDAKKKAKKKTKRSRR